MPSLFTIPPFLFIYNTFIPSDFLCVGNVSDLVCHCRVSWGQSCWVMSSLTLSFLGGSNTVSWERRCCTETTPWPAGKTIRVAAAAAQLITNQWKWELLKFCIQLFGLWSNRFSCEWLRFVVVFCWRAYKTIIEDDLKFPLIYGEGKKVRC